jgi:hypothetical protein
MQPHMCMWYATRSQKVMRFKIYGFCSYAGSYSLYVGPCGQYTNPCGQYTGSCGL